jgi:hypothetical protein
MALTALADEQGDQMSFLKNRPKCSPTHFCQNIFCGKKKPKNSGYFFNFPQTGQCKQSPERRKFAQSGHPADDGKSLGREQGDQTFFWCEKSPNGFHKSSGM